MYTLHRPIQGLTYWGRDKIVAISQTTFSNPSSWMKMCEFRLRFHWSVLLLIELTIFPHCFRYCLGTDQAKNHYLYQWWLVYWRIHASLGLNELNKLSVVINSAVLNIIYHNSQSIMCHNAIKINLNSLTRLFWFQSLTWSREWYIKRFWGVYLILRHGKIWEIATGDI